MGPGVPLTVGDPFEVIGHSGVLILMNATTAIQQRHCANAYVQQYCGTFSSSAVMSAEDVDVSALRGFQEMALCLMNVYIHVDAQSPETYRSLN